MTEMTVREARELLIEWAAVAASRDARIRSAFVSGLSKSEIARLTGVARTTIDRILDLGQVHSSTPDPVRGSGQIWSTAPDVVHGSGQVWSSAPVRDSGGDGPARDRDARR